MAAETQIDGLRNRRDFRELVKDVLKSPGVLDVGRTTGTVAARRLEGAGRFTVLDADPDPDPTGPLVYGFEAAGIVQLRVVFPNGTVKTIETDV